MSAMVWCAAVACGGVGALARHLTDVGVGSRVGGRWPAGTLTVNLLGAFALGLLTGLAIPAGAATVLGGGLLGGYTTFSTWMWESVMLADARRGRAAVLNTAGQLAAGLACAAVGWALGAAL